nr:MAG TPA: hypothetical protein [Bacteriophage sp.]
MFHRAPQMAHSSAVMGASISTGVSSIIVWPFYNWQAGRARVLDAVAHLPLLRIQIPASCLDHPKKCQGHDCYGGNEIGGVPQHCYLLLLNDVSFLRGNLLMRAFRALPRSGAPLSTLRT